MSIKSDPSTWKDARHRRGLIGERVAMAFLKKHGWTILAHRYRLGRIEVDLVARKDDVVSFIEVKTRRSHKFGQPLEAITWAKKRDLVRVADAWRQRAQTRSDVYRFDVIGVTMGACGLQVDHIADAFRPGWR